MCSLLIFTTCKLFWAYHSNSAPGLNKYLTVTMVTWCLLTIKYDRASDILEVDWQCKHKSGKIPFTPLIV